MGAPKDNAPEGAPAPPTPSGRRRPRRSALILGAAAFISATAITAALLIAVQPTAKKLEYTRLPAPCTMVTAATLASYAPEATGSSFRGTSRGTDQYGGCTWFSNTLREGVSLYLAVTVYGSPDGVAEAERDYYGWQGTRCRSQGCTRAAQAVPGLGDQATSLLFTLTTSAANQAAAWTVPQIVLVVRSGNALVTIQYAVEAGAVAPPKPTNAALVGGTVAMAREVLAALSGHPYVQPTASASPQGPLYASPPDACTLVKASTLAKYAPGATVDRTSSSSGPGPPGSCYWIASTASTLSEAFTLSVDITIYASADDAQAGYELDVQTTREDGMGTTRLVQSVKGLGKQATAIFQTVEGNSVMWTLETWSGNAEVETTFSDLAGPVSSMRRATMLAGDIAMARDVLADLPR